MKWWIDATHTSHTTAQTGIQQVVRELVAAFGRKQSGQPVVYDPFAARWRVLDTLEQQHLDPSENRPPQGRRGAYWSKYQILRGYFARLRSTPPECIHSTDKLLIPEIFDANRDRPLNDLKCRKVALFYDAIPLLFPKWTPPSIVQRFPQYLERLSQMDHIICISETSQQDLLRYLQDAGLSVPRTDVLTLGIPNAVFTAAKAFKRDLGVSKCPTILMVGSIEARKNHLALLEACEALWKKGHSFSLRLIGMLNRQTGLAAHDKIQSLRGQRYPLRWEGAVQQEKIIDAYKSADLFIYPSLYEGFGIPILEARAFGLPVITTSGGALKERLDEGGCLATGTSPHEIARALGNLLIDRNQQKALIKSARSAVPMCMSTTAENLLQLLSEPLA
jgi:glycosyltransferase involved in cell wall biosynthesis